MLGWTYFYEYVYFYAFILCREQLQTEHEHEMSEIKAIIESVTLLNEEKSHDIEKEMIETRDDINSKHTEMYHYLKMQMENEIEELKDRIVSVCSIGCSMHPIVKKS